MAKTIAAVQSNYIPWKGYFDLIRAVDEFILYDDVQYTRRDWRNRNLIKTPAGRQWLTIPVHVKGRYDQLVKDVRVADGRWGRSHWAAVRASYGRAPFFSAVKPWLEPLYLGEQPERLSDINRRFLTAICAFLEIRTPLHWAMDYGPVGDSPSDRLIDLCRRSGASSYLSGPAARGYLEVDRFVREGIDVKFFDYSGYRPYPQLHPPFEHAVSILDLLCMTGDQAARWLLTQPVFVAGETRLDDVELFEARS